MPDDELSATADAISQFDALLVENARALFSAGNVVDTLQMVVDLAVESIEGCDAAGIFLRNESGVTTPALTSPVVAEVDAAQHRFGEGPCLEALDSGGAIYADELNDDIRWPRFGPEASALGIRSALAVRILGNGARGALNLYASFPQAFGVVDRARAVLFAGLSGVALTSAEARQGEERRFEDLEGALVSRGIIGQAQGILIERERITADQAFTVLRQASQHLNIKLRDIAQDLVDTGERPETGSRSPTS